MTSAALVLAAVWFAPAIINAMRLGLSVGVATAVLLAVLAVVALAFPLSAVIWPILFFAALFTPKEVRQG